MILWTLVVVLLVLWALGLVTAYTFGGLVHVLLAAAVGLALARWVGRRRAA
jgi:hypothetical protein